MKYRKLYEKNYLQRYKDKNDNKVEKSISEVVTPSGIYLKDKWIKLIYEYMDEKNEGHIFEILIEYAKKECLWTSTEEGSRDLALDLYSNRIWEKSTWLGFEEFNIKLKNFNKIGQLSFL